MKPSSPLSLLLFLQLASTSPIPIRTFSTSQDCTHSSCSPSQQAAFLLSISKPHTPPTHLSEPHFPSHQLSSDNHIPSEIIDNTPLSPPKGIPATIALTASRPLVSSYLLSLSNTLPTPSEDLESLPAKPTSSLAALRQEDARQYWKSLQSPTDLVSSKKESNAAQGPRTIHLCGEVKVTTRSGRYLAHGYSDLIIVGVVVLFLVIAVAVEAVERMDSLKSLVCCRGRKRRGEIYLSDDDETAYVIEKPFYLQPVPKARYKIAVVSRDYKYEESGSDTEVEEFSYDSDAFEKV